MTQQENGRTLTVSRPSKCADPPVITEGALTPIWDINHSQMPLAAPQPLPPEPLEDVCPALPCFTPLPGSPLAQKYDVVISWDSEWCGLHTTEDPREHRNLLLSYQVAVLYQHVPDQWHYGEGMSWPETTQHERLTLGQLLWFSVQRVGIGRRRANGLCVLLLAHNTTADWAGLADRATCFGRAGKTIRGSVVTGWRPSPVRFTDSHGNAITAQLTVRDSMLLAPEKGHALKDLAQFTVHQKLDIGDWVTRMDAYLHHDRAGYIAYAMNDSRVALEYYVGFLNQYWQAFGVPDVPMTLGGASASAYLMGLGGTKSATYYRLFGLRDREVQWGTRKVMQKGKEDARHYSETLAAESYHGGMNLTYVLGRRQCMPEEVILDLDPR
jgi:hypothetical protein